jgi:hypothetical protein
MPVFGVQVLGYSTQRDCRLVSTAQLWDNREQVKGNWKIDFADAPQIV